MNENVIERLTAVEQSTKSAHHRIDKLEEAIAILHEMNTNIRLLTEQNLIQNTEIKEIKEDINTVSNKVDYLEKKPLMELYQLKWIVLSAIVSGLVGYYLSK